ncbi:hypothetical protein ACFOKJ_15075 [Vogesella amnigena]|uniref:Solute-binding protein family 3/N-terminal domain-containing protein n=1 Tax=Vogesella amnigena TaxID=1507449 RepID=A0ABV7TXH7_9NEIS
MRRLLIATLLLAALPAQADTSLRLVMSDQAGPPYLAGVGRELANPPGLAMELVQQAARHCAVRLEIDRQASLRLLQNLRTGMADAALLLSYNAERGGYAHYPLRDGVPDSRYRLTTLSYSFYVRSDSNIRWDGRVLSGFSGKVGTDLGWSVVKDLEQLGIAVENAVGVPANLGKLRLGRIKVYAAQNIIVDSYLQDRSDLVALTPPIVTKDYFLPFSLAFAASNPQTVQCMWQQIAERRDTLYRQRAKEYEQ